VQPPTAAGVPKAADLQLSTLDYDDRGQTTITGQAAPGTAVRAYIDDKMVAEGMAGADGKWRLAPTAAGGSRPRRPSRPASTSSDSID